MPSTWTLKGPFDFNEVTACSAMYVHAKKGLFQIYLIFLGIMNVVGIFFQRYFFMVFVL